jgi:hypothetical protein
MDDNPGVSPPKRRARGGKRVGAGRKRKQTPLKVQVKTLAQNDRRAADQKRWKVLQEKLVKYTKRAQLKTEKYQAVSKEFLELTAKLQKKFPGLLTSDHDSSSSDSEVNASYMKCLINFHVSNNKNVKIQLLYNFLFESF